MEMDKTGRKAKDLEPGIKIDAVRALEERMDFSRRAVQNIEETRAKIFADMPKLPEQSEIKEMRGRPYAPAILSKNDVSAYSFKSSLGVEIRKEKKK